MNQNTQLRQLVKESIQEYIREVEASGNIAAQEAKVRACEEAIALREKKANMEGLDEAYHDMMDQSKLNELKKEIKALESYKKKAEKLLEKMKTKADKKDEKEVVKDGLEEEGIVDEVSIDEYTADPAAGPELEESISELTAAQSGASVSGDNAAIQAIAKALDKTADWVKKNFNAAELKQAFKNIASAASSATSTGTRESLELEEAKKKMTTAQKAKKEDIVKGMKKSKSFGKSKEEKAKMYATATKLATKESTETEGEVLNEQFLHMQKLAGLITETQYKEKMQMLSEGWDDFNGPNWIARIKEIAKEMGYAVSTGWDGTNTDRARLQAADEAKKGEKKAYLGMADDNTIVATFTLNQQEKEQNKSDIQKKVIDLYKNYADVKTAQHTHGDTIMQVIIKDKTK